MKVSQNIVPAAFTPTPEQYAPPVTQELRSKQSKWALGYATNIINNLQNELRKSFYKRSMYTLEQGYNETKSDAKLVEDIKIAKTAQTVMMDHISEWAGNYDETVFNNTVLPDVWAKYVNSVRGPVEETEETEITVEDDALALEYMEPVVVVTRPEVPEDAPPSEVVPPDQINLGEILGKIEADNSKD